MTEAIDQGADERTSQEEASQHEEADADWTVDLEKLQVDMRRTLIGGASS